MASCGMAGRLSLLRLTMHAAPPRPRYGGHCHLSCSRRRALLPPPLLLPWGSREGPAARSPRLRSSAALPDGDSGTCSSEVFSGDLSPHALVLLLQQSEPAARDIEGGAGVAVAVTRMVAERAPEFSASKLLQAVHSLARLRTEAGNTAEPASVPLPGLPPSLLSAGADRLADAVNARVLSAEQVAMATWTYAVFGAAPRRLFDAACRCLIGLPPTPGDMLFIPGGTVTGVTGGGTVTGVTGGTLRDLGHEDLARVAWAFAVARFQDERHRGIRDVGLFNAVAQETRERLTTVRERLTTMPSATLVRLLSTLAAIPHYEPRLLDEAADVLVLRSRGGRAAMTAGSEQVQPAEVLGMGEVLSLVRLYAKQEHRRSKGLLLMLFQRAAQALPQLPPGSMLDLVQAMISTGCSHPGLLRSIVCAADRTGTLAGAALQGQPTAATGPSPDAGTQQQEAQQQQQQQQAQQQDQGQRAAATAFNVAQLLELARAIASLQHLDPSFYATALPAILRSVHHAHLATELSSLSVHCGTSADGVPK
ncbi:hypothetical protein FOA52_007827 [Chlamydomonas sp. UWO 241]|nr:hypothetical protein FOA52_007827 [Chlamydomonas sp. UWO 241]